MSERPPQDDNHPAQLDKGHPLLAAALGLVMWPLRPLRGKVVSQARGRVLEIGVGTGLNFAEYGPVDALYGIEPDPHMLRRARARARRLGLSIKLEQAGAERLPYPESFFDSAVLTWVLCTIPDPAAAVAEVLRVLKPGGSLLYVEHTRSRFPGAARLQDRLTPLWKKLAGGCHLNRDAVTLIREAGFCDLTVKPCGREHRTLLPVYRGAARKPV